MPNAADRWNDKWNQRYAQGGHAPDPPLDFIARLLPLGQNRRALDLACGTGRHAFLMASRGWQVTAVDWSQTALQRMNHPSIQTIQADLEAGQFLIEPNTWDLICVSFYMQRELFPAIAKGLKTGGILAAAFPLQDAREGVRPMRPEFCLGDGELHAIFNNMEVLHNFQTNPTPPKRRTAEFWARKP